MKQTFAASGKFMLIIWRSELSELCRHHRWSLYG